MDISSKQDVLGGVLLIGVGTGTVVAASQLTIGHLTQMGAGYLPIVLGCTLIGLGLILLVSGLMSRTAMTAEVSFVRPDWRGCGAIIGGLLAFLIIAWRFGLAPAAFACVFIAALGDRRTTFKGAVILAAAITLLTVGLFAYGLKIQFPVWRS